MPTALSIPILKQLVPSGFQYGEILLVVYEPDSIWYDTSLTIAALALKDGIRVEYHTYEHIPAEVRSSLSKLGEDVKKLEEEDRLRIHDSYTGQTGLAQSETPAKS